MRIFIIVGLLLLIMSSCVYAGSLATSSHYGAELQNGNMEFKSGTIYDYDFGSGVYGTLDMTTSYSFKHKPQKTIDMSLNWYPKWFLEGNCISSGVVFRDVASPNYYMEISINKDFNPLKILYQIVSKPFQKKD